MKTTIALLFSMFAAALAAPPNAELAQVHKVYLLPMSNGMDQYLANWLTKLGIFQVVTDPKKADAIFTDHLGEAFEGRQAELFPQPVPPVAAEPPAPVVLPPSPGQATNTPQAQVATPPTGGMQPAPPVPPQKAEPGDLEKQGEGFQGARPVPPSSFHRAKGTLFLVDPHSRVVVWSVYEQPKNGSAAELDRTAERIVSLIQHDLAGRKPKNRR
jgi:hypothetical protein